MTAVVIILTVIICILVFLTVLTLLSWYSAQCECDKNDEVLFRYIVSLEETSAQYTKAQERVEELTRENDSLRKELLSKNIPLDQQEE